MKVEKRNDSDGKWTRAAVVVRFRQTSSRSVTDAQPDLGPTNRERRCELLSQVCVSMVRRGH